MIGNILLILVLAAVIGVATAGLLRRRRSSTGVRSSTMLGIDQLKSLMERDAARVVDVRTRDDFNGELGHIAGAVNLPLEDLMARIAELGDDRAQPIALICRTDRKSAVAAALLVEQGFTAARAVRGGMTAWCEQGLPTTNDILRN